MPDAFFASLRKRLADLRLHQAGLRREDTEWFTTNALIGQIQAIIADYERLTAPLYADGNQRCRVWSRAKAFAASPVSEITVKQGEQEARLVVRRLDARGVAAEVVQRGEKWIVRKMKGESK